MRLGPYCFFRRRDGVPLWRFPAAGVPVLLTSLPGPSAFTVASWNWMPLFGLFDVDCGDCIVFGTLGQSSLLLKNPTKNLFLLSNGTLGGWSCRAVNCYSSLESALFKNNTVKEKTHSVLCTPIAMRRTKRKLLPCRRWLKRLQVFLSICSLATQSKTMKVKVGRLVVAWLFC